MLYHCSILFVLETINMISREIREGIFPYFQSSVVLFLFFSFKQQGHLLKEVGKKAPRAKSLDCGRFS